MRRRTVRGSDAGRATCPPGSRAGAGQIPATFAFIEVASPTCIATRSVMMSRPPSIRSAPSAEGSFCCGSPRNAAAMTAGSCSPRGSSVRTSPSSAARSARSSCSCRGVVRGMRIARLSSDRISQKVLYPRHGHHADGALHQQLDVGVERHDGDVGQTLRALPKLALLGWRHERAEHQHGGQRDSGIVLVGAQHPVDDRHPVIAAAHGHQHIRLLADRNGVRFGELRHRAAKVSRVDELVAHRQRTGDALERVREILEAVDPDLIVDMLQRGEHLLALPFLQQELGLVHDVAQAQHERGPLRLQHLQRRHDLALEAERLLVHQKQVRTKAERRLPDDGGAHLHGLVEGDVQAERLVFAVGELDHAGNAHEIDPRAEVEAADDGRSGQNQHRHALEPVHQRVRDRPTATQVAEAEAVVAVDQDPCVVKSLASFHPIPCLLSAVPDVTIANAGIIHDSHPVREHTSGAHGQLIGANYRTSLARIRRASRALRCSWRARTYAWTLESTGGWQVFGEKVVKGF